MANAITYKTEDEIALLRVSARLVGQTLGEVGKRVKPGVSTLELDQVAEEFIRDNGGIPAFKNYQPKFGDRPFPCSLCVSVNEEVVHGFALADKVLKDGDIVSIDCGVLKDGYYGDSAYTFAVGEISSKKRKLLDVTKTSLLKGIEKASAGSRLGEISNAIQKYAELYGFSVVREMVGHGVGTHLHEPPEVPNYGKRRSGPRLKPGMVLAIEPMINMGRRHISFADDGWTVFASDHQPSAHFEHMIVIRKEVPEILTTYEFIEN